MAWFHRTTVEEEVKKRDWSISDPAFAEYFNLSTNYSGETVSEWKALNLSAVYRAASLVSGTIASLPLRALREQDGRTDRVRSWLDNPSGDPVGSTQFEWIETLVLHLIFHGNVYLLKLRNGAGAVVGAQLLHPLAVTVERAPVLGGKTFTVEVEKADGSTQRRVFDAEDVEHIVGPHSDGVKGLSFLAVAANSIGTTIAADKSAATSFKNGASFSTLVTPEEDITADEAQTIKDSLTAKMSGPTNAGGMAVINRKLKLSPWSMSLQDAQFLESRQFQIEEIARWFGVPPHLLMQTEKQTSWGTGVEEQNRGLARHTLMPITSRIEQRLTRLLSGNQKAEFDYKGYLKPAPKDEINLLILQVNSGLLTLNEAREIQNMPPLDSSTGADLPRVPPGAVSPTENTPLGANDDSASDGSPASS
jgi:HK97 family phage portal protein